MMGQHPHFTLESLLVEHGSGAGTLNEVVMVKEAEMGVRLPPSVKPSEYAML
jgi:hypothetical protein